MTCIGAATHKKVLCILSPTLATVLFVCLIAIVVKQDFYVNCKNAFALTY